MSPLQRHRWLSLPFVRRASASLCLALCAGILVAGCRGRPETQSHILIEHEISPQPTRAGAATVTLKLTDIAGRPLSGARLRLEGHMSHPGMAPVLGEALEVEPGRYRAPLEFTMGGDWVILIQLKLPDGREEERQFDVKGVQSG